MTKAEAHKKARKLIRRWRKEFLLQENRERDERYAKRIASLLEPMTAHEFSRFVHFLGVKFDYKFNACLWLIFDVIAPTIGKSLKGNYFYRASDMMPIISFDTNREEDRALYEARVRLLNSYEGLK